MYPSVVLSTSSRNEGTKVRLDISKMAKTLAAMYNVIRLVWVGRQLSASKAVVRLGLKRGTKWEI